MPEANSRECEQEGKTLCSLLRFKRITRDLGPKEGKTDR